jgi:hypothetical protein
LHKELVNSFNSVADSLEGKTIGQVSFLAYGYIIKLPPTH